MYEKDYVLRVSTKCNVLLKSGRWIKEWAKKRKLELVEGEQRLDCL